MTPTELHAATRAHLGAIQAHLDAIKDEPCTYCGAPSDGDDYLTPLSKGGVHDPSNIVRACSVCRAGKGDRTVDEWLPWQATG